jgi:toxin ParE1/3/4
VATVFIRPKVRADLAENYVYLAEHAGEAVADRFFDNAEATFNALSIHPLMGSPLSLRAPELAGLRKWPVAGFDNHLIFYFPRPDGISVVRVLHAAQDWWGLFGIEDAS